MTLPSDSSERSITEAFATNPIGMTGLVVLFLGAIIGLVGLFFLGGWRRGLLAVGITVGALLILLVVTMYLITSYRNQQMRTRRLGRSDHVIK